MSGDVEPLVERKQVNAVSLELLLNEIVPLTIRTTKQLSNASSSQSLTEACESLSIKDKETGKASAFESDLLNTEDVNYKLENLGYGIGLRITELIIFHNDNDGLILNNDMELLNLMKFVCRDVWKLLYGKQMDNLRTNHKGTFVLIDNNFKTFRNFNSRKGLQDTIEKAKQYLWISGGIIRGVLKSFGIESLVTPEITTFPSVSYSIQTNL
jgi:hypothetical protein